MLDFNEVKARLDKALEQGNIIYRIDHDYIVIKDINDIVVYKSINPSLTDLPSYNKEVFKSLPKEYQSHIVNKIAKKVERR